MQLSTENPGIKVDLFHPSQASAVRRLISSIQINEFEMSLTLEQQPDLADIPAFYQHGAGNFWVATYGNQVAGTIALLDIGDNQAALRKMFVHQDFRGSAHSTARILLDNALNHAKSCGLARIYLGTTAKFLAAQRFYEKNGFIEIKKETLPKKFPVMAVDSKFYRKTL